MAHEITIRENGKAEMAFAEGTRFPWHFKDTKPAMVPHGSPVSDWVGLAGMDWDVCQSPVIYEAGGVSREFAERFVLHRSDTFAPLGVVSDDYCILHPRECIEFFSDLVASVGLKLDTAGTLFGGRRFWALASVGEACMIDNRDPIKGYLLLTSSADGSRATEARFTSVRVVCANTLAMSEKDSAGQIKVTHRSEWDSSNVKKRLGIAPATFEQFMANMRKLADKRLTDDQAAVQVKILLGKEEKDAAKEGRVFAKVMDLFRGLATGSDLPGVEGTAYGLLNAVTEAVDHRSKAMSDSHRLQNSLMGAGAKLKIKARDQLLALV
jgi:phage/plasmid-like protein (TIGR03299 family)